MKTSVLSLLVGTCLITGCTVNSIPEQGGEPTGISTTPTQVTPTHSPSLETDQKQKQQDTLSPIQINLIPSGKWAEFESKYHVKIHDGDVWNPPDPKPGYYVVAYTECKPAYNVAEVYVNKDATKKEVNSYLPHEFGHVLQCWNDWDNVIGSDGSEHVADAVASILGGFIGYGEFSASDLDTAQKLLNSVDFKK